MVGWAGSLRASSFSEGSITPGHWLPSLRLEGGGSEMWGFCWLACAPAHHPGCWGGSGTLMGSYFHAGSHTSFNGKNTWSRPE